MNMTGRGPSYSKEEREKLLALYDDNPDATLISIGEKAVKYGICGHRSANAIAQFLSKEIKAREDETKGETEEQIDIISEIENAKADFWKDRYMSLLKVLIEESELYDTGYYKGLRYNYKKITKWLIDNEGEWVRAWIEELEAHNWEVSND